MAESRYDEHGVWVPPAGYAVGFIPGGGWQIVWPQGDGTELRDPVGTVEAQLADGTGYVDGFEPSGYSKLEGTGKRPYLLPPNDEWVATSTHDPHDKIESELREWMRDG